MAISSANFQKTKSNSVAETTREFEAKYLLPNEHRLQNEFYNCGTDEKELFHQELAKAQRQGGRVPKLENSLWEGVINLNKNHTIEDVNRVGEHIAKKFNLHYTRGALHRDEGHIDEKGKVQYNFHAHINFMTYKDGKQNWRLEFVNKEALRELQTEVAQLLNMDRGQLNSKSVRANHRHFRENAEDIKASREALKEVLATKEQLKEANNKIRNLIKENNGIRADYAPVEAEKKVLEEKLKAKLLTEKELLEKFKELEKSFLESKNQNKSLQEQKEVLASKVITLEEKINPSSNMSHSQPPKDIQEEFKKIRNEELEEKDVKTGLFATEKAKVLKSETNFLQRTWNIVASKYEDLKNKYNDLVFKYNQVANENKTLKAELEELKQERSSTKQIKKENILDQIIEKYDKARTGKDESEALNLQKTEVKEVDLSRFEERQNKSLLDKLNAIDEKVNTNTKTNARRGRDR